MVDDQKKDEPPEPAVWSNHIIIIGAALFLGLASDYFFFQQLPGLSFSIFVVMILSIFFLLSMRFKLKIDWSFIYLAAPLLFFSAMVFVRSSELLTFVNLCITLYLLILIADFALGSRLTAYSLADYFKPIISIPLNTLDKLFMALSVIFSARPKSKEQKSRQVLRGVLLTLPVVLLFLMLLSSADMVFRQYVDRIVDIQISPQTISRTILVLFVTGVFTGVFTYIFQKPENMLQTRKSTAGSRRLGFIEGSILLASIDLVFLSFILIQITYLFGGSRTMAVAGITYAQYARSGFFQLLAVSIISFLLVWLTDRYISRDGPAQVLIYKSLNSVLVFEVMVIMASAFKRLLLYEDAFGFTVLRFYSHAATIWLAVVFVILLLKILAIVAEARFLFSVLIASLAFTAALNIFNPDAFIAQANIDRHSRTGKIDFIYLSTLSDDAAGELVEALEIESGPGSRHKERLGEELYRRRNELRRWSRRGWQSLNLSRSNALQAFNAGADDLKLFKP